LTLKKLLAYNIIAVGDNTRKQTMTYDAQYSLLEYDLEVAKQHYQLALDPEQRIGQRLYSSMAVHKILSNIAKRADKQGMKYTATCAYSMLHALDIALWEVAA